ncbi:MAG TPA: twin-arginine translocase TatA/TatE family subunit [Ktedonobacteraceae bacterium]|nr:twin-arginine translocase TatA/TatE family subunit [Ktedonobacteraceae bacterium]
MGFHFMDLVVVLVIGLLIFGPKKLQEISRGAGKTMRQVNEIKDKMLADLQVDELTEVRRQIPTIPTNPQQAFKMIVSEEKPASKTGKETPEVPHETQQSENN